jgi:hypothetical protein
VIRRIALAGIAAGAAGLLLGAGLGGRVGTAIAAAAALALPAALAALGAARGGGLGLAGAGILALVVLLESSGLALLLLPPSGPDEPSFLGLPFRLALFLGGLWLLPLIAALAAYTADFGRRGIAASDLERLRRLRAAREEGPSGPP